MVLKLVAQILASSIRSNGFDFLAKLILNFVLKLFKLFKGLRFGTHQIDISISTIIVRKRNEISVASSEGNTKLDENIQCVMTHHMVRHDAPSVCSLQWLWT